MVWVVLDMVLLGGDMYVNRNVIRMVISYIVSVSGLLWFVIDIL